MLGFCFQKYDNFVEIETPIKTFIEKKLRYSNLN